jgi:hypothetical protein
MKTITLDILDDGAINLLKDLEALKVIRLHDDKIKPTTPLSNLAEKYSGKMSQQSLEEIDKQLNDLRNEWD